MEDRKDGGPAFPRTGEVVSDPPDDKYGRDVPGMSLRDYYIAHAPSREIDGMLPDTAEAAAGILGMTVEEYTGEGDYVKVIAVLRGRWADAMLAEREKEAN